MRNFEIIIEKKFEKMNSIWDASFFVVDVETTGSSAEKNRIFDIACLRLENGEIVSEYSSLINPHQFIPPYISKMTGVTNAAVYSAKEPNIAFNEVYERLTEKPTVFVAHNAPFDHSFLRETFKRFGLSIEDIPVLCTLKLARRLLPKNLKKNVGSLAEHFGHNISRRHRAYDDTLATAVILNELLEIAENEYDISTIDELLAFQNKPIKNFKAAPPAYNRIIEDLKQLPRSPGVYYFYAKDNSILYIGKAKSLKDRVSSYFTLGELSSKKIADLVKKVYYLKWQELPTELEALLLESSEIKRCKPPFNSALKKTRRYPFIKFPDDEFAYPILSRGNDDADGSMFGPFRSSNFVEQILLNIEKQFKLRKCTRKLKPDENNPPCFYYEIGRCLAPCALLSDKEEYQKEIQRVKIYLSGVSDGIINQLENKMHEYSENLEFEKAQMLKNQIYELKKTFLTYKSVGSSVVDNNLIVVFPDSSTEKTVVLYFIKNGKFVLSKTIGTKAPKKHIKELINEIYAYKNGSTSKLSPEDIDEIRIVLSWLFRNQKHTKQLYVDSNETDVAYEQLVNFINDLYDSSEEDSKKDDPYFDDLLHTFNENQIDQFDL